MDPISLISHLDLCEAGRPPLQLTPESSLGQIFDWDWKALRALVHYLSYSLSPSACS